MRSIPILIAASGLLSAASAQDRTEDNPSTERGGHHKRLLDKDDGNKPEPKEAVATPAVRPVVINLERARREEAKKEKDDSRRHRKASGEPAKPDYGRIRWNQDHDAQVHRHLLDSIVAAHGKEAQFHAAQSAKRQASTVSETQERFRRFGVRSDPGLIINRSELVVDGNRQPRPPHPEQGPDRKPLLAKAVPAREFETEPIRRHMAFVESQGFQAKLAKLSEREILPDHHYWHRENGFVYNHYLDPAGIHWYGWYMGDRYFWTRRDHGRWWWYDDETARWCFWNDNFWWWQDPNHVADLYVHVDNGYVPSNSDRVVVATTDTPRTEAYISPDTRRIVKIFGESKDAFLYDAAKPSRMAPVYLASGVDTVQFSVARPGKPLGILLKLDDGTFDLVDSTGSPFVPSGTNPGIRD